MLCGVCQQFDVEKLYQQAADLVRKQPPVKNENNVHAQYDGVPYFFKQHASLAALKASCDSGCELCRMIWSSYSDGKVEQELAELLSSPVTENDQIYLGLSQWAPTSHGFPYIAAVQKFRIARQLAVFEVFAPREHYPGGYDHLIAKEVASSPSSAACLSVATNWIRDCKSKHKLCTKRSGPRRLPTRVLDVGPPDGSQEPHLKITNGAEGDYVALSYCWGGDSVFILKGERLEEWKRELPLSTFPATLRDAVIITRSLGIRHIWIDALCIIQDSTEDWAAEAAKMGDVYRNANVTVSAASSPRTDYGILRDRPRPDLSCQISWKGSNDTFVRIISGKTFWDGSQKASILNTRGWTLQEALLAPRTLSYGNQLMVWECQELQQDEAGRPITAGDSYKEKDFLQTILNKTPSLTEKFLRKRVINKLASASDKWSDYYGADNLFNEWQQPYNRWLDIVVEYTSRRLTVATDVMPALAGLAAAFQPILEDEYCAGLWKNDLIRGLLWKRTPYKPGEGYSHPKDNDYRAPTWSWASTRGRKAMFLPPLAEDRTRIRSRAKILEVSIETESANPFGQIKSGYLRAQGPLYRLDDPRVDVADDASFPHLQKYFHRFFGEHVAFLPGDFQSNHEGFDGQTFVAFQLQRSSGVRFQFGDGKGIPSNASDLLLLESTGKAEGEYRRIGLYRVAGHTQDSDWDRKSQLLDEIDKQGDKDAIVRII